MHSIFIACDHLHRCKNIKKNNNICNNIVTLNYKSVKENNNTWSNKITLDNKNVEENNNTLKNKLTFDNNSVKKNIIWNNKLTFIIRVLKG